MLCLIDSPNRVDNEETPLWPIGLVDGAVELDKLIDEVVVGIGGGGVDGGWSLLLLELLLLFVPVKLIVFDEIGDDVGVLSSGLFVVVVVVAGVVDDVVVTPLLIVASALLISS